MVIDVVCDGCGTACAAGHELLGEAVECPVCGQVFTAHDSALSISRVGRPVAVDAPEPVTDLTEVFGPPRTTRRAQAAGPLAWAEQCGIGQAAGAALIAAGISCVFGIISPVPVRIAMLALPVWAVGFICVKLLLHDGPRRGPSPAAWDGWNGRPRSTRSSRDDRATALARGGLIAGAGAAAAVWGVMVHGRSVFDLTASGEHPLTPTAFAVDDPVQPVPPSVGVRPPPVAALAPIGAPAEVETVAAASTERFAVPAMKTARAVPSAPMSMSVPADPPADPVAPTAPADDAEAVRSANEDVTVANLRAIHRALAEHVGWSGGRYPARLGDLSQTPGMRAVLRSPFTPTGNAAQGPDAGYTLAAAGRSTRRSGTADLAVVYDAAELADRGVTVGITAAGRLVYLDAEQVAAQRVKWAAE